MQTELQIKDDSGNSHNNMLPAVKIGKYDMNGVEMKAGDIIQRLYKYEIKLKENNVYAHILDGSNFHLSVNELGRDFMIINSR